MYKFIVLNVLNLWLDKKKTTVYLQLIRERKRRRRRKNGALFFSWLLSRSPFFFSFQLILRCIAYSFSKRKNFLSFDKSGGFIITLWSKFLSPDQLKTIYFCFVELLLAYKRIALIFFGHWIRVHVGISTTHHTHKHNHTLLQIESCWMHNSIFFFFLVLVRYLGNLYKYFSCCSFPFLLYFNSITNAHECV